MDAAQLIKLALTASVLVLVFALGLRATFGDATFLFRTLFQPPNRLLRSVAAMFLLVPLTAAGLAASFDLPLPVEVAMVAFAIAPVPPVLPGKQLKFGGEERYVFGLLVAISLASVVLVPVAVRILGWAFDRNTTIGAEQVARTIGLSVLLPLLAGLLVRQFAPGPAQRLAPWMSRIGTVLLVGSCVPILVASWPKVASLVGSGAILAMVALVAVSLVIGHVLGGPDPEDREVLGIASAMRHPGIALAIATRNFPGEPLVPAAILMCLIVAFIGTSVYGVARRRRLAKPV